MLHTAEPPLRPSDHGRPHHSVRPNGTLSGGALFPSVSLPVQLPGHGQAVGHVQRHHQGALDCPREVRITKSLMFHTASLKMRVTNLLLPLQSERWQASKFGAYLTILLNIIFLGSITSTKVKQEDGFQRRQEL